jgi:hypothetical protein
MQRLKRNEIDAGSRKLIYERGAKIYSETVEDEEESIDQRGSHPGSIPRASAGPSGNGNPCVHLRCTVSLDAANMGQSKGPSTAIMTVG